MLQEKRYYNRIEVKISPLKVCSNTALRQHIPALAFCHKRHKLHTQQVFIDLATTGVHKKSIHFLSPLEYLKRPDSSVYLVSISDL